MVLTVLRGQVFLVHLGHLGEPRALVDLLEELLQGIFVALGFTFHLFLDLVAGY